MRHQSGSTCVQISIFRIVAAAVATLTLLCWLAPPAAGQRDARVLQRNLAELVGDSYTIVMGRVISVYAEPHPQYANIQTIVVTVQVAEVLKGQAGQQFTFRAFVNHPLDQKMKLGYGDGQDVLLMLTQPSNIGLSSPAGLEQGRFRITTDDAGNRMVKNGLNNAGLFRKVDQTAPNLKGQLQPATAKTLSTHTHGPIPYDQLKQMIQALVNQN